MLDILLKWTINKDKNHENVHSSADFLRVAYKVSIIAIVIMHLY